VVSSFLDTQYPFTEPADGPYVFDTLRQAYVSARHADLAPAIARESRGLGSDARLYLVPSTKQLLSPTWKRLSELAVGGAVVYVSYSNGTHLNQRGPWYPSLNELFGVRHQLRYGLVDPIPETDFDLTFTRNFGSLPQGTKLRFPAGAASHGRTMLPVEPAEGTEVIAVDEQGRPALLVRRVGSGAMVLCTYPIEHLAATSPAINPDAARDLYDALARYARVERPVTVEDAHVAADMMVHQDGTRYVWLISQADRELTVKPVLGKGLRSDQDTVTLAPYGVAVLRLES
jgi:hypothetical protein